MLHRRQRTVRASAALGSLVAIGLTLTFAGRGNASPHGFPVAADTRTNSNPKPITCTATSRKVVATATVVPDYLLQSIEYVPVGNASSVTYGAGAQSGATTTFASSTGYSTSTSTSVQETLSPSADGAGVPIGFNASMSASTSSGSGSTQGSSMAVSVTTNTTFSNGVSSAQDAPDHGRDVFVLWMMPSIVNTITQITETQGFSDTVNGPCETTAGAKSTSHDVSSVKMSGGQIAYFTVDQLLGYDTIGTSNSTEQQMAALFAKLSPQDKQQILAADPFVRGGPLDTKRYVKLTQQIPGVPSFQVGHSTSLNITNSTTTTTSQSETFTSTSGASVSGTVGVKFGPIGISTTTTTSQSWNWSQTTTAAQSRGTSTIDSASFGTKTAGYMDNVTIYWDTLYGTFLFRSQNAGDGTAPEQPPQMEATMATGGQPQGNQYVELTFADGSKRLVRTDASGHFSVRGAPAGAVTMRVAGKLVGTETLGAGRLVRHDIRL